MKPRPLILITPSAERKGVEFSDTSLSLSDRYPRAILAAGGVPWVLPCLSSENLVAEAVRRCEGVMLTGGDDGQPEVYADHLGPKIKGTVSAPGPSRGKSGLWVVLEDFRHGNPELAHCLGPRDF